MLCNRTPKHSASKLAFSSSCTQTSALHLCHHLRQEQGWPAIAGWFGLEPGPPLKVPLAVLMPKHEDTWRAVQQEHDTKVYSLHLCQRCLCVLYHSNGRSRQNTCASRSQACSIATKHKCVAGAAIAVVQCL